MSNNRYVKGRAFEYFVMRQLEKQSYQVYRCAGSHSEFDLITVLTKDNKELPVYRFIQCKAGNSPYKKDLIKIKRLKLPSSAQKEIWIKKDYQTPQIIVC